MSEEYVNSSTHLLWQCSEEHEIWVASPSSVKMGSWCPVCAGNVRLNIEQVHKLAQERGGKCLSTEYINSKTKLWWKCKRGHAWEAEPSNVKHGTWCPECGWERFLASRVRKK